MACLIWRFSGFMVSLILEIFDLWDSGITVCLILGDLRFSEISQFLFIF